MGFKRTPLKKGNSTLKKGGGLKKSSSLKKSGKLKTKPISEEKKKAQQEQWDKDKAFYEHIWDSRPHVCVSCDKPIYGELRTVYIEHGLPKSTYPQYRYSEENCSITCFECHSLKESGFPTEKYKIKLDELLDKHKNGTLI